MKLTPHERAMLDEMGIFWPAEKVGLPSAPPAAEPKVESPPAEEARSAPATAAPLHRQAPADWQGLRDAVSACRLCTLAGSRTQTVFGVGHPQAHWMIVGEAPGEQEDRRGEPFVGAAGQLLDRMLAALGLSRQEGPPERQVFITNTLKCRPPANRNPQPDELSACAPYLKAQLSLVKPRMVLAMGRFAAQQLLGSSEAIGRLRGRVHQVDGVPVVVTYHPAYLLRNPVDKARAWDDLCLAWDHLAAQAER